MRHSSHTSGPSYVGVLIRQGFYFVVVFSLDKLPGRDLRFQRAHQLPRIAVHRHQVLLERYRYSTQPHLRW